MATLMGFIDASPRRGNLCRRSFSLVRAGKPGAGASKNRLSKMGPGLSGPPERRKYECERGSREGFTFPALTAILSSHDSDNRWCNRVRLLGPESAAQLFRERGGRTALDL